MSVTERFAALFAGREDAYGTEEGGCLRVNPNGLPSPAQLFEEHLDGITPIGVYPLVPIPEDDVSVPWWYVKWGCVDLDVKGPTHATGYESAEDALDAARNLVSALRALSLTGWIERTRSGGFHVWVFAAEWVPASIMRRALLVACAVVEVPPSEVNPKSEGFDNPDTLGNYVRLPYPGGLNRPDPWTRAVLSKSNTTTLMLSWFLAAAEETLAPTWALESAAGLYVPAPAARPDRTMEFEGEVELDEPLRRRLGGLTFTILTQGPLDGSDRSGTLFRLAHACKDDGLNEAEALAVVTAGDLAWGKYHRRHDAERYLRQTVERAYT